MDRQFKFIIAAGSLLFAIIFFVDLYVFNDLYFSGMAAILLVALGMSFFIMQDTRFLPEISIFLSDNAKNIIVANKGNDSAEKIHVAIVPLNIEFDIPALAADDKYEYPLPEMISEAKATADYQNSQGRAYSQTFRLSALGKSDDDLLKPVIPLFRWK
ncbi:MAG: hypothetical protein OS112_02205 [Methanoregula sp.]|nr:MAG: hypothetical protein OS112_02205 [Methanoregula sp.]